MLEKVHRVIQFNQKAWLKPYIEMNTKLRTGEKNDVGNFFKKLVNSSVFGKTMEPNYHTTKWFSENELAIEMKKKSKNE